MTLIIVYLNNLEFETRLRYDPKAELNNQAEMNILCKLKLMRVNYKQ